MYSIVIDMPFQTQFNIITNCSILLHELKLKYGRYAIDSYSQCLNIIRAIRQNDGYIVTFRDFQQRTNFPLSLCGQIILENLEYDKSICALHGASLFYKEKAFIFLAPTTSGKTTLTAYLLNQGMSYITDDCILLDRENFFIHPCTTPLHLRKRGLEILRQYNLFQRPLPTIDEVSGKRFIYAPEHCVNSSVSFDKIYFIKRSETLNDLRILTTTEKIIALLKSPITHYPISGDYIQFISKIAQTKCFELQYCEMEYVYEVIHNG